MFLCLKNKNSSSTSIKFNPFNITSITVQKCSHTSKYFIFVTVW